MIEERQPPSNAMPMSLGKVTRKRKEFEHREDREHGQDVLDILHTETWTWQMVRLVYFNWPLQYEPMRAHCP